MKNLCIITCLSVLLGGVALGSQVSVVRVEGAIGPASAKFMTRSIDRAEADGAACLVFELDTPGGLDESMRQIIKRIMSSKVPVVVYVAPQGSRAASAGAFITLAAHVAAMAPGTAIGAAHPVSIGQGGQMDSTMSGKVTNDAAAYIRSIAAQRGRNAAWADSAVRSSVSLSETEARRRGVIDLVAPTTAALLDSLDGRAVALASGTDTIRTGGAAVEQTEMTWRDRFLHGLANPNLAYIFFMIGLLGLYFEFSNPGAIFPGVAGAIGLILAFFAFQTLSVSAAGILLIVLAVVLFVLEIKAPTHGILTIGGVIAMTFGSIMLFTSPDPAMRASLQVIIPVVLVTAAFFIVGAWLSLRSLGRKPESGAAGMVGREGDARTPVGRSGGSVFVDGAHWNAVAEADIPQGAKVRVVAVKGMTLTVERAG